MAKYKLVTVNYFDEDEVTFEDVDVVHVDEKRVLIAKATWARIYPLGSINYVDINVATPDVVEEQL